MHRSTFKAALLAMLLASLAGCATAPGAANSSHHLEDPWEAYNRKMFAFNEQVDKAVAKPVAQGYQAVTPYPVRLHITNFFNNLQDGWTVVNNALQLRPVAFLESAFRFGFNTLWGFGGFVNVADDMQLARAPQDFGKTLGRWGVPPGPYMVLPFWGASTLRDTAGLAADVRYDLLNESVEHIPTRNSLYALRLVDKRANLLAAGNLLEEAALDKYAFTRNAYLQKRRADISALRQQTSTGSEPEQDEDDYYPPSERYDLDPTEQAPNQAAAPAAQPKVPAEIGSAAWLHEANVPAAPAPLAQTPSAQTPSAQAPSAQWAATNASASASPVGRLLNK